MMGWWLIVERLALVRDGQRKLRMAWIARCSAEGEGVRWLRRCWTALSASTT